MDVTLTAVFIALQTAPLIAMAITIPFVVYHYKNVKSLNVRWFTYLYIFVLYFICAYFMTMLPLPNPGTFAHLPPTREMIRLVPFNSISHIKKATFVHDILILVFNVFLTVPLGFFLRYLFRLPFKKVMALGFMTTLMYEVTQITGIFYIYPRAYRYFDVDDLIINTFGAFIGYLLVPLVSRMLPSPFAEKDSIAAGSEVSFTQRCVATAMDFGIVLTASIGGIRYIPALKAVFDQSGPLMKFPLFYLLFLAVGAVYAMLFREGTLGARLTHLRLMSRGGRVSSRLRCSVRFIIICTSVIAIPFWVYFFMTVNRQYAGAKSIIWVFCGTMFMIFAAAVLLEMMFNGVTHGSSMFYDRIMKTYMAYDSNRNFSLFGIRVIDIQPLTTVSVDLFSQEICDTLQQMGIAKESVTKVRLMTEGVMLDWIEHGLSDTMCELRLDKRYKNKMLMLSVSGDDKTNASIVDSYAEMLKRLNLNVKTYYAAEKNICNILIP